MFRIRIPAYFYYGYESGSRFLYNTDLGPDLGKKTHLLKGLNKYLGQNFFVTKKIGTYLFYKTDTGSLFTYGIIFKNMVKIMTHLYGRYPTCNNVLSPFFRIIIIKARNGFQKTSKATKISEKG